MKNILRLLSVAAAALCLLTTSGCVRNQRWQASAQPSMPALPAGKGQAVAVIEFDGMGELWDRCDLASPAAGQHCQLRDALAYIRDQRVQAENKVDVVVVTYVHGWHHNAQPDDHDFENFSSILEAMQTRADRDLRTCNQLLAKGLGNVCPPRPTKFLGAYIAWRGEVVHGFINELTAFDREKAAQRTALVSMSEVIVRLRNAAKQTTRDDPSEPATRARFLLFGHSYGGMIVERIMSQMLTAALLPEHQHDSQTCGGSADTGQRPFADLIFMINPAGDAIETEQLLDLMKRSKVHVCRPAGADPNFDPPLIVAIHARNDFWTGTGFAMGHTLESTDKVFRHPEPCDFCDGGIGAPPSQKFLYQHSVGFIPYFHNYCYINAEPTGDPVCERVRAQLASSGATPGIVSPQRAFPHSTVNKFDPALTDNLYRRIDPKPLNAQAPTLPWNDTPYWLFTLPKKLVNGHGGFWTPEFTSFVSSIVQATTPPEGTSITMR